MTLLFFADIHGVPETLIRLFGHAARLAPDRLILLGDALYHDPCCGAPDSYDLLRTAEILNTHRREITAVRGNCDTEEDQRLLDFPIMSGFAEISAGGRRFFLTHGHKWNRCNPPPVADGTVLAHGHTHIPEISRIDGVTVFNPGSISLPKWGMPKSFGFFDGERLSVRRLEDGSVILSE